MMQPSDIHETRSSRLAYDDIGGRLPLLLIHAFPLDRAMWRTQITAFAPGRRIIAADLAGFGESAPEGRTSMADHADDLASLLDHLGSPRVVAVGLSMGGYVALELWRRHRHRLGGLVLADTRATADTDADRQRRKEMAAQLTRDGAASIGEALLPQLLDVAANPALAEQVGAIIDRQPPQGLVAALTAMSVRADFTSRLGEIDIPTLVMVGARDAVTPAPLARAMADAIPGARLAVVPGALHLANVQEPGAFNAALRAFLDTADARARSARADRLLGRSPAPSGAADTGSRGR